MDLDDLVREFHCKVGKGWIWIECHDRGCLMLVVGMQQDSGYCAQLSNSVEGVRKEQRGGT